MQETIYAEFGIGNAQIASTEVESEKGEVRLNGWHVATPISVYIRIWVGHLVVILDSREGLKVKSKKHSSFKLLLGVVSK